MMYFMFTLLKTILYMEQAWNDILTRKQAELDERQKKLDSYFKIFDILAVRKDEIPETGNFIVRFKRLDMAMEKDFKEHPEKYAIIEEDK